MIFLACVSASLRAKRCPGNSSKQWRERFGVEILDGIGSTEALHISYPIVQGRYSQGVRAFQ